MAPDRVSAWERTGGPTRQRLVEIEVSQQQQASYRGSKGETWRIVQMMDSDSELVVWRGDEDGQSVGVFPAVISPVRGNTASGLHECRYSFLFDPPSPIRMKAMRLVSSFTVTVYLP
ncbi:MAG: hypothetical protein Q9223_003501 [Gallowayella weberi]